MLTFQWFHIHLRPSIDVNVLAHQLVIHVDRARGTPCFLTQAHPEWETTAFASSSCLLTSSICMCMYVPWWQRTRQLRGTYAPVLVEFVVHALLPGLHDDLLLEVLHGGSLGYDGLHHELAELKGQGQKKGGLKWWRTVCSCESVFLIGMLNTLLKRLRVQSSNICRLSYSEASHCTPQRYPITRKCSTSRVSSIADCQTPSVDYPWLNTNSQQSNIDKRQWMLDDQQRKTDQRSIASNILTSFNHTLSTSSHKEYTFAKIA